MEDYTPTPEETAALIKTATFGLLVSNLLENIGMSNAAIWAPADYLEDQGHSKAAWALRGRIDCPQADWFITHLTVRDELPAGHSRKRLHLRMEAVGTDNGPPLWVDNEDDLPDFPTRKRRD